MHNLVCLQAKINKLLTFFFYGKINSSSSRRKTNPHTINEILQNYDVLGVGERYFYQTASFVYKTLKFTSPVDDISKFFVFNKRSRRQLLTIPLHRTKVREKCIAYQGAKNMEFSTSGGSRY